MFGRNKDLADNSAHDAEAALQKINAVMWQYPAKAVCLVAIVPTMLNLFVFSLKEGAKQFNNISPDLLTDVMLSLMRHIDGKAIGGVHQRVLRACPETAHGQRPPGGSEHAAIPTGAF
jgi:hypothetical protein